jgi:competence protein ComEA
MKWKTLVENYFTFSRPQRRSILVAVAIIVICIAVRFGYSYFFSVKTIPADTAFLQEAERLTQPDTTARAYQYSYRDYNNEENAGYNEPNKNSYPKNYAAKGELFAFDPNTLNADGWRRLGLRDKTIETIQNYISKGGEFRKPEDIKRIYGLFPDQAERLMPYVRIASSTSSEPTNKYPSNDYVKKEPDYATKNAPATIDINTADTSVFISLPGIGSKLASRIVGFRDKLGGFHSVDQIGETYGLPDSVFQRIRSRFVVSNVQLKKININAADANTLKANPYIKWNVANAIMQYRMQHGNYISLDDLKKIAIIDEQTFSKIKHYLTL